MDREQIEKWAREAGYVIGQDGPDDQFEVSMHRAQIEHFARLVRADVERERDEALVALRAAHDWIAEREYGEEWPTEDMFDGCRRHILNRLSALLARVEEEAKR